MSGCYNNDNNVYIQDTKSTRLQHRNIVAATHLHLNDSICLGSIMVKVDVRRMKNSQMSFQEIEESLHKKIPKD